MSNHTPGPWRSNEDEPDGYKFIISEQSNGLTNDGYVICEVFGYTVETEANARLIVKAPEMFEALKMIAGELPCVDSLMSDKDIARSALAKIKGEV